MSEAPRKSQLLVYQAEDGAIKIDVRFEDETVCEEGELEPEATHKESLTVRQEGARQVSRDLEYYNDAIISVGYRVKSRVATQFRMMSALHRHGRQVSPFSPWRDHELLRVSQLSPTDRERRVRGSNPEPLSSKRVSSAMPHQGTPLSTIRVPKRCLTYVLVDMSGPK